MGSENITLGRDMDVKFYLSNLNSVAKAKAYEDIKTKSGKVIILTPDRNTLNIEREVIRAVNGKSIFDLNVTTFSRIARGYLVDKGLYKSVLTKHASIALIKKILLESKGELRVFGSSISKDGFCQKIFEAICLYKSCRITPDDFYITSQQGLLDYKLHDIHLIYDRYEKYLGEEYTDSFNQLDLYANSIQRDDYSDTDFYLVDFEDITPAISRIIAKLAVSARTLNICTTYSKASKDVRNANIYTNDIFYNLSSVLETEGIRYSKIMVEDDDVARANVTKRLYGANVKEERKYSHIGLQLIKANNVEEELRAVCTDIKKSVLDRECNISDIALVVSNLEGYKVQLKEMLSKTDISYYFDQSDTLADNVLCKIILLLLEIASGGITKYNILQLIDTGICKMTMSQISAYKSYIGRIDAKGKYLYTIPDKISADDDLTNAIAIVKDIVSMLDIQLGSIDKYRDTINTVLQNMGYDAFYELMYAKYIEADDVVNAKKLSQSYNKLSIMWNEMTMLFGLEEFEPKAFYEIFKAFVEDIMLSLPPIKVASLVVSDFESCYLSTHKRIYFVGANDDALPKYSMEAALLSDKEIEKVNDRNRLAPTINMINKRKKFKLFEMVQKATERLIFSYVCVDAKGEELYPSMIYDELAKYIEASPVVVAGENIIVENCSLVTEKIAKGNITKKIALENVTGYIKEWNLYSDIKDYRRNVTSIYHALGDAGVDIVANASYNNVARDITKSDRLFFCSSEVSPSQFEKFANCPYAHFLNYGLRLRASDVARVSTNDIGNIIHDYMRDVVYDLYNYRNDEEFCSNIKEFATSNLTKILSNEKYARFQASSINATTIRGLYEEIVRITVAVVEQMRNSSYEPYLREFSFDAKKGGVRFVLPSGKIINIVGKVDRIDINREDNTFYIIDYKTGNSSFSNFTDLVAGKKIQLFVYMMLYKNASGMQPVGAFYLPIDNKLEKTRKYRFQGFFDKRCEIIGNIDNVLREFPATGMTLRVARNKDGSFAKGNAMTNLAISASDMDDGMEYLVGELRDRAEKIERGCVDIMPLNIDGNVACKFCEYGGICNFNIRYGNKYRKVDRVHNLAEVLEKNNEASEVENV